MCISVDIFYQMQLESFVNLEQDLEINLVGKLIATTQELKLVQTC